jgi:hypothetical protein
MSAALLLSILGIVITVVGSACAAAWIVSRAIHASGQEVRTELGDKIDDVGTGLHVRVDALDRRVDTLENRATAGEGKIRSIEHLCDERHRRNQSHVETAAISRLHG